MTHSTLAMSPRRETEEAPSEPAARSEPIEARAWSRARYTGRLPIPLGLVLEYRWYAGGLTFLAALWLAFGMVMGMGQHPWTLRATLAFVGLIVLTIAFVVLTAITIREESAMRGRQGS